MEKLLFTIWSRPIQTPLENGLSNYEQFGMRVSADYNRETKSTIITRVDYNGTDIFPVLNNFPEAAPFLSQIIQKAEDEAKI